MSESKVAQFLLLNRWRKIHLLLTHTISIPLKDLIILKHKCEHLQTMFLLVLFRTKIKCWSYSAFVIGGAYKILVRGWNLRNTWYSNNFLIRNISSNLGKSILIQINYEIRIKRNWLYYRKGLNVNLIFYKVFPI